MKFDDISIAAVTALLPPNVVTSDEIEHRLAPIYDRLRLPYGRLELMTGIKERRFWDPGTRPSDVSAEAGKLALAQCGVPIEKIGCLIHGAVCRDFLEPATASVVHNRLGLLPTCQIFDLSNACLGVLNSMVQVASMIQLGQIEAGLIVTGEVAEPLHEATIKEVLNFEKKSLWHHRKLGRAEFKKHFASLTIGSAAAAVVLAKSSLVEEKHELLGGAIRTDSHANDLCQEDVNNGAGAAAPLMSTDSEGLLHAGVTLATKTWEAAKATLDWDNDTPDHVFTHQVGAAHKRLTFEALNLDPGKDFPTVQFMGNTGSAALPGAFALGVKEGKCARGEKIALMGIGSGLSCLMLGIEW